MVSEMPDLGELSRIDAAIQQRNETELLWAWEYCRAQITAAIRKNDKGLGYWVRLQRDVDRVLREVAPTEDHIRAHVWCCNHRQTLRESTLCGCFYCLEVFPPSELEDWVGDGDTALCPRCGIDSVIGSASGYPIEREFLKKMHDYWF